MKRQFGVIGLAAIAFLNAAYVHGQSQTLRSAVGDKYVISARAGGVNLIEGPVGIVRKEGKSGLLLKGDTIEVGDRVSTGAKGRAEILLNPGSYIRIDENSAFEFKTTDLEDLQIKLDRGSAILEVFAGNDFNVTVLTPKEDFGLVKTGVYRIDVAGDGSGRIEVWKGKAEVGNSVLKSGRAGVSGDGDVAVEKFDRGDRDEFETWSKFRAKELAKITDQLKDKELRTSLMRSFLGGRWNMYDSFGLWVYSASFGRYCFLPFGYGWSSPYGYGFGTDIWWYNLPRVVYYPPVNTNPPAGGGTPPRGGRGNEFPGDRRPTPPVEKREPPFAGMQGGASTGPKYVRGLEKGNGGGASDPYRGGGGGSFPSPSYSPPVKSAPVYSPPPSSSPAPIRGGGMVKPMDN